MCLNTQQVLLTKETWIQTQRELSVYGYVIERVDRADGYGGITVGLEIASITYYLIYIPPCTQQLKSFFHWHLSTCAGAAGANTYTGSYD
jgi:hypothetical protein